MTIFTLPLASSRPSAYPTVFPTPQMRQELDRLFNGAHASPTEAALQPAADIVESDNAINITLEVPGVAADSIEVLAEDGVLTIRGIKTPRAVAEGTRVIVNERSSGSFSRRFRLAKTMDSGSVTAHYADGVLAVQVAKITPPQPRRVTVNVGQTVPATVA